MGLSSNQARFLSLTSRQVDLEHRIQQICQRRLRLTSELENIATSYNNSISNRKMFTPSNAGIQKISLSELSKLGYKVIDTKSNDLVRNVGVMNKVSALDPTYTAIGSAEDFMNLANVIKAGGAAATTALAGKYVLTNDIDLSGQPAFNKAVIDGLFTGTFDGQGHTISGANIVASGNDQLIGLFAQNSGSGTIKNLVADNINITAPAYTGGTYSYVGGMVGRNQGNLTNVGITNSSINLGDNHKIVGGLAGQNTGTISYAYSTTDIVAGNTVSYIGGLVGDPSTGSSIAYSYATGDITAGHSSSYIAGFRGGMDDGANTVSNCYSTGDITVGISSSNVGGFVSDSQSAGTSVTNSYTTGNVVYGTTASTGFGGFAGVFTNGTIGSNNFYQNNMSTTFGSAITDPIAATAGWNKTTVWDFSEDSPTLRGTNDASAALEEGLRSGRYSLVREADEFSQDPLDIEGEQYEEIDWRSTPEIFDELYKGDDVEAENKYDKTVDEINSQDKKLQLEQTTIEVEYKAISSEKEAVKKILDTNAQSSFKYFS